IGKIGCQPELRLNAIVSGKHFAAVGYADLERAFRQCIVKHGNRHLRQGRSPVQHLKRRVQPAFPLHEGGKATFAFSAAGNHAVQPQWLKACNQIIGAFFLWFSAHAVGNLRRLFLDNLRRLRCENLAVYAGALPFQFWGYPVRMTSGQ
ncbi:MAG: hypothetical protein RSD95_17415, partial [Clostridia bacterium]